MSRVVLYGSEIHWIEEDGGETRIAQGATSLTDPVYEMIARSLIETAASLASDPNEKAEIMKILELGMKQSAFLLSKRFQLNRTNFDDLEKLDEEA